MEVKVKRVILLPPDHLPVERLPFTYKCKACGEEITDDVALSYMMYGKKNKVPYWARRRCPNCENKNRLLLEI